jgi:hypothetical protein
MRKYSVLILLLPFVSGCDGEFRAGGGDHKVTSIVMTTAEGGTDGKVGQPIQLVVKAYWAIPSLTDETATAAYKVEPADMGVVNKEGVFAPAKAGEVRITASYEGFTKSLTLAITE